MTKIFFIEMRRSPLRWWLPFLVLVDVSMLFSRSTEWIGVWPQTSAAAQLPVFYFAIILAAGAAWASGRAFRSETTENLAAAASPPWRREAIQLATTVVYGLMPFLVGTAVAAVTTAVGDSPRGFLWPGYLVLATVLIVCTCALGHLLGRTIQSKIAAPLIGPVVVFMIVGFGVLPFLELAVLSGAPQFKVELVPMLRDWPWRPRSSERHSRRAERRLDGRGRGRGSGAATSSNMPPISPPPEPWCSPSF